MWKLSPQSSAHKGKKMGDTGDEATHRKRLAQVLRYIASMHHSLQDSDASFVQACTGTCSNFFQRENDDQDVAGGVLFSTDNFRQLLAMETADNTLFAVQPFAFYAASTSQPRKRTLAGTIKKSLTGSFPEKACWLRITRLTSSQVSAPPSSHPDVRRYLNDWLGGDSSRLILTRRRLEQAPKVPPTISVAGGQEIKAFLRKHKKYLRKKAYQLQLEPIYNRLFEWIQNQQDDELVWGLGHARMQLDDGRTTNGPVLEVQVEVELDRDGALLIRPREHTGVCLCREVVAAIGTDTAVLQQLHRMVVDVEPANLSPGQPATYVPLLRRIAVQLSAGGSFQSSATAIADPRKLVITEGWCLFARPKPNSVWARDAVAFADQILLRPDFLLPTATWSITHGPGSLQLGTASGPDAVDTGWLSWFSSKLSGPKVETKLNKPFLFPLPASDAQNRIADLLLNKKYPAVVCEGPPGSGKSQTIANMICAYLCSGKRVLVTSKNSPALSVLRNRLPKTVQELCVDVSMSESAGMRQLQQTVERLANRVASVNSDMETQKYLFLQSQIAEHEKEVDDLDCRISKQSESVRQLLKHPNGQRLIELSTELLEDVPWLMKTLTKSSRQEVELLKDRVAALVLEENNFLKDVTGYSKPPADALVSLVASKAGAKFSVVSNAAKNVVAALPLVGSMSGMEQHTAQSQESLSRLLVNGNAPTTADHWKLILRALRHSQNVHAFEQEVWNVYKQKDGWPKCFLKNNTRTKGLYDSLEKAVLIKQLAFSMNVWDKMSAAAECRSLDAKRSMLASRIQVLSEELVNATVVAELSRSFSAEAQSALIRFAQIAGKAKFNKASQPSKMSHRQRRRRQEYLDAFDSCCRFIPCWIMTSAQISQYLPSECLFDLVIIDESSQSDATVVPGMLRGTQWLVVGDGKQVSPTESFVSEEQIDSLRAALPDCSLENSLLPGQSFFDLCAQAFPNGRVVLNEHFRCAPEIIAFSNDNFYDGQLIPLRRPMKSERIVPSIVDVRVRDGTKIGKINENEADEIVRRVSEIVYDLTAAIPRSIGIISLIGDEQSRLIRGRLLDAIGPHLMARHDILVGDPPAFQGAERDVVFLSMVCSSGSTPTQSQLMHFQRANVALSRARDQIVLVRSLDISDIPSVDDMKIPIIEFFQAAGGDDTEAAVYDPATEFGRSQPIQRLLAKLLVDHGYVVRSMGIVWKNAVSIEHPESDMRAAVIVDCIEDSAQEWRASYRQQKAIGRVGWKSLRVDALSLLTDVSGTLNSIMRFLSDAGVEPPQILYDGLEDEEEENEDAAVEVQEQANVPFGEANALAPIQLEEQPEDAVDDQPEPLVDRPVDEGVFVISSDEEGMDSKPKAVAKPDKVPSGPFGSENDEVHAANYGSVVDLAFLLGDGENASLGGSENNDESSLLYNDQGEQSSAGEASSLRIAKRRRKYRRIDQYQRDGRFFPGREPAEDDPDGQSNDWFDVNERRPGESSGTSARRTSKELPNDDDAASAPKGDDDLVDSD